VDRTPSPDEKADPMNGTILIVDDDEDSAALLRDLLRRRGLDVRPRGFSGCMKMRTGVVTVPDTVMRRFAMAFDRVNLRTSLHLGVSTLLYGAPKYSTGPYVALSPLRVDYDLGRAVRIVWDPMEMALAVPLLGQLPLYY
jgi:hypothetical protein